VCFAAGSRIGPVTTLVPTGNVTAVASAGDSVYVGMQPPDIEAWAVSRYRIPVACR